MAERISLAHGDGGELAHRLIADVFVRAFGHTEEARFDAALCSVPSGKIAVTTDSFVVKPAFFPGGNIGKLAVAGTVNDLAVSGAIPLYLTAGFMIEEGFKIKDLKEIVQTMAAEAEKANVRIIAGDTKVVEKGSIDGIYINTTGVGYYADGKLPVNPAEMEPGDAIIVNGTIGDHGVAVLAARAVGITTELPSDCASLNGLIQACCQKRTGKNYARSDAEVWRRRSLKLPKISRRRWKLKRNSSPSVGSAGACDILGYDPLYLANEEK